jgi:hypothetical protein
MSVRMRIRDSLSQAAKISYNPHDSHVRRSRRGDRSQSPSVDSPPEPSLTSSFCRRLMACISGTLTVVRTRSSRATVKRGCPPLTEVVRSMHVIRCLRFCRIRFGASAFFRLFKTGRRCTNCIACLVVHFSGEGGCFVSVRAGKQNHRSARPVAKRLQLYECRHRRE